MSSAVVRKVQEYTFVICDTQGVPVIPVIDTFALLYRYEKEQIQQKLQVPVFGILVGIQVMLCLDMDNDQPTLCNTSDYLPYIVDTCLKTLNH